MRLSLLILLMACGPTSTVDKFDPDQPAPNSPDVDDDGDGYTENEGDCNDNNELVGPDAVEIVENLEGNPEGSDNNCNGLVDEQPDCGSNFSDDGTGYAGAIGLCDSSLVSASLTRPSNSSTDIATSYGTNNTAREGQHLAVLSTGGSAPGSEKIFSGGWGSSSSHPLPQGDPQDNCGSADPTSVSDLVSFRVNLKVPFNAQAIAFDFSFFTAEFPSFVCTEFDDTFLAILTDQTGKQNISFDENGNPATINAGFFDVCPVSATFPQCMGDAELNGINFSGEGGGTGWLKTVAPVVPGSAITIDFTIFDEGDDIYDSIAILDNFRWLAESVDGPVTID